MEKYSFCDRISIFIVGNKSYQIIVDEEPKIIKIKDFPDRVDMWKDILNDINSIELSNNEWVDFCEFAEKINTEE